MRVSATLTGVLAVECRESKTSWCLLGNNRELERVETVHTLGHL